LHSLQRLRQILFRVSGGRELAALGDQALVSGANFITNVILARSLGVTEYGVFALAWMTVLFVNSLQWALVVSPMMSVGPKQATSERPAYFGAVLAQEIAFAVLSALLVMAGVMLSTRFFPRWNVGGLTLPLGFVVLSYLLQDFLRRYFFSVRQSMWALITDAASYLTQLPILLLLAKQSRLTSAKALWIIGLTSVFGFVVGGFKFERITMIRSSLRDVSLRHWRISRWLLPSAFMQWSAGNLFAVAAPLYYGAAAAGVLRSAQNIVGVAHIWFLGLDNVVPAEAARRMHTEGLDSSFRYIRSILVRWGLVTLAFVICIGVRPDFWLKLVYGSKYASYGYILQLYALLYLMAFFSGPLRAGLQALEYTRPVFWSYLAMTIFSILLAGPSTRLLGLRGAMLGMIATQFLFQCIVGTGLWLHVRRLRRDMKLAQVEN
jgi:O-antigen/teichoic acid export membrane protein